MVGNVINQCRLLTEYNARPFKQYKTPYNPVGGVESEIANVPLVVGGFYLDLNHANALPVVGGFYLDLNHANALLVVGDFYLDLNHANVLLVAGGFYLDLNNAPIRFVWRYI